MSAVRDPHSAEEREADVAIDAVVGPEFLASSDRLKAVAAHRFVLNLLTTLAVVRSHNTYDNRMVILRATNAKLVARTFSLVQDITETAFTEVQAALVAANYEVKTANAVTGHNET